MRTDRAVGPPADIDDYLARVPAEARAALEKLRRTIRAVAPDATEVISYRIPTFRQQGMLVAFAAFPGHLSFYLLSPAAMKAHRRELAPYRPSGVTIQFQPGSPLPVSLVRKLVRARIAENEARRRAKAKGAPRRTAARKGTARKRRRSS